MIDFSLLFSYFARIKQAELSAEEKDELSSLFKKEKFKKKEIIFRSGDSNTRHYYIEKGLLRMYIIDNMGKEFNVVFAIEKQWIGDLGAPAKTDYYLESVEKSSVFSVEECQFKQIIQNYPAFSNHIRKSYVFLQKRFVSVLSKTAEENYLDLLNESPGLIQRLPQYHISSYLGVTPVFLSKIISRTIKKKTK